MKANQPKVQSQTNDPELDSFNYQLDILKLELHNLESIIGRIDEITQTTKNWAIITWAGIVTVAIGQPDLRKFIIFTSVLPLFFWLVDAHWRHLQRRSTFRVIKIGEFLNDGRLLKSFEQKRLVDFSVYDPVGAQYRRLPEYKRHVSTWRVMNFKTVRNFYLSLAVISLIIGTFFIFYP